jgi:DNA-binding CsgD family transcriptional regulator
VDDVTRETLSDILSSALDRLQRAEQATDPAARERELGVAQRLVESALRALGAEPALAAAPALAAPDGDRLVRLSDAEAEDALLTPPLTQREEEVLRLMASGLRNKEIAARLGITERTATFHVGNVLGKLGADGRVEAIHLARRRHLI